ncbi:hypothetical protein Ancab_019717 [Ancistrocladus abbreviatus]
MGGQPKFLNPLVLHLQKMGLALKCPSCLNFYEKPMLLPCSHVVCNSCVSKPILFGSQCPECRQEYVEQDLRKAPYMENLVDIYRSLDATFSTHILQPVLCDPGKGSEPSMFSAQTHLRVGSTEGLVGNSQEGKSSGGPNIFLRKPRSVSPCSQTIVGDHEQLEAVDVEENHVIQLSSESPPYGLHKGIDHYGSDLGSGDDSIEKSPVKGSIKRTAGDLVADEVHGHCGPLAGGHSLSVKKQKQNISLPEKNQIDFNHTGYSKSMVSSGSRPHPVPQTDTTNSMYFICAFCQSWKITEYTGQMLHYANGNPVEGDEAACSNVIHVHRRCIEWAPQIYFKDDTVKNLNKELSRGAKLKCGHCGLKGAALGCYVKSCRKSFHVPCALNVPECRWDTEKYLMLCPDHSSYKFPSEKSRKHGDKTQAIPAQITQNESRSWEATAGGNKWVLCGSALSTDDKFMLVKFASMCGATVMKSWNPNVTHVIAATDANGACTRTLKVLMAILKGRWILKLDWIKACMEVMRPVNEEPYEVCQDNHGCCVGPKTGRLRALNNEPKLFSGLKFFLSGDFVPTYKEDLQDLIMAGGGTVLESKEQLMEQRCSAQPNLPRVLVVYNSDTMVGQDDLLQLFHRQAEAENLAAETGTESIAHTWLLDSIASCELQPFSQR